MVRSIFLSTAAAAVLLASVSHARAEIRGEPVEYRVGGEAFEGYFVRNTALNGSQPVVVIVHDWNGPGEYERRRARMLAELGYAAFAVDLYGKGVRPRTVEEMKARSGALYRDRETMRQRLFGGMEQLGRLEGVDPQRAVVMGYCFGGAAVLELARAGADAQGFVTFHGGLATPEGQDYSQVGGPVLVLHGSADSAVPMSDVAALAEDLDEAGVDHRMEIYGGVPHAFTEWSDPERYHAEADLKSWATFTRFLEERLR